MFILLIADDHRLFVDGLKFIIEHATDYQLAGVVHDGNDVLSFLDHQTVDLLLLDVNLPSKSGHEVAIEVTQKYPSVKILAISMLNDYESVEMMLGAGAMGYCLKSAGKDELLEAITTVREGNTYVSPSLFRVILNGRRQLSKKTTYKNPFDELTAREIDLLKALVSGKNLTCIADELSLSKHTVESHRKNIYAKLNLHSLTELMVFVGENKLF